VTIPLHVLVVEDDEADAALLLRELKRGGLDAVLARVDTAEAMAAALDERPWDLVLSDHGMPRFSAPEALALLKERGLDLPFIIVSGHISEEAAVAAMKAGAHDYILKGNWARLVPAIRRELAEAADRRERRRAEAALVESEERYRLLIENAQDAISVVDAAGRYVYVSPSTERISGHSIAEGMSRGPFRYIHPDDQVPCAAAIARLFTGESRVERMEFRYIHRDGTTHFAEGVGTLLPPGSMLSGVVANWRDVTDRKRAEEALRQSEEQLRQSQKMEAIGQLAGGVAHDFNNNLTVILSYADEILRKIGPEGPVARAAREIVRAGESSAALTRQLLAFSRRQLLRPTVLDLNAVVTELDRMLRRLLYAGVELVTIRAPDLAPVLADRGQVEQVIVNLVVNARDAMPEGGVLTVETANVELTASSLAEVAAKPGRYAMIAVTDTGHGIDAETRAHLFEPFFTTKEVGKGTGLGLATVYGIVKQSGGYIAVESEPGKGAAFRIYLPATGAPGGAGERAPEGASPRGSETVLLVEDDLAVRDLVREVLARSGYRVLVARSGTEALRLAEEEARPLDLVLADVVTPGIGGPELVQRLGARALFVSGHADRAALPCGARYLPKPFTPDALLRAVRDAIDAPRPGN
jgi:PAS domain S-box-containing protein